MTVRSVRQALSASGQGGVANPSVMTHLFGFWRRTAPTDPATSAPVVVSVDQVFTGLSGRHVNLNVIEVGLDTMTPTALADADDKIDYAMHRIRQIWAARSLGLGRVGWFWITAADSGGLDDIGSESEFDTLTDRWTVPGDGIDMFFVRNISAGFVGISPRPGDCDKNDKSDGLLGGFALRGAEGMGRTAAHELGHFLSLAHTHGDACPTSTTERDNLMSQTRCAVTERGSVVLTSAQGTAARGRCQVRAGS